jgi:Tol biopolymer transport system component
LVVVNRDGTNQTVIASGQWYNVPSWHPDGNEIIFSGAIPETGIWSIRLNRGSPSGVSPPRRIVPQTVWGGVTTPVWSPLPIDFQDGLPPRHVIAYGDRPAGKTNNDIFLWDPETATSYNLTRDDNHYESYPTWSPDGLQLVIVHTSATGDYPYDMKLLTLGFGADCPAGQSVCEIAPQESLARRLEPDPGTSTPDCYVPAGATQPSPLCATRPR